MNLVVGHYHLQPGGVTRIIQSQLAAVVGSGLFQNVTLVSGFMPDGFAADLPTGPLELTVHAKLDYLAADVTKEQCRAYARDIRGFLESHLRRDDILHFHNPILGKNPVLTHVLFQLAREGYRLFYHCHDFAEDREVNFAFLERVIGGFFGLDTRTVLYPVSDSCLFGVLNSRDYERLVGSGIEARRIRFLPNPVSFPDTSGGGDRLACRRVVCDRLGIPADRSLFLYPVRVIRRKNIGELILLASLFSDRAAWLVTLAPHNPVEREFYVQWRRFNEQIGSPVHFEAGHELEFATLMQAADRIVTTSRQEGFGMTYLEPWTFGKPVVGRDIPYVTRDFTREGLALESLYRSLPVSEEGHTDFGDLPDERQRRFIERIRGDERLRRSFIKRTGIESVLFGDIPADSVRRNREIVEHKFSLEGYESRLRSIYQDLSGTSDTPAAPADR